VAINAYMTVKGQKQGQITGDATQKAHSQTIPVLAFTYGVTSPRDAASGLSNGKRFHQPVQVTSPTGSQSPKLFNAIAQNENLTTVEIDVYMTDRTGKEVLAYSIKLTNAQLSEWDVSDDGSGVTESLSDQYSFTFQSIVVTWATGGIAGSDTWLAPIS
jgi:type VI secretion system secreted protein Hcp